MTTTRVPTASGTRLVLCLAVGIPAFIVVATLVLVPMAMFMLVAGAGDASVPPEVPDPPAVDDEAEATRVRGEFAGRVLGVFVDVWRWVGTFPPGV